MYFLDESKLDNNDLLFLNEQKSISWRHLKKNFDDNFWHNCQNLMPVDMISQVSLTLATRYPIEGYRPVQEPPNDDLVKGKTLLECLERILPYFIQVR